MAGTIEQLLIKHEKARGILDCGNTFYWELVKRGEIEVVGDGKGGRAVLRSVHQYVERLRAKAASGESGVSNGFPKRRRAASTPGERRPSN
jgi:hypothetical protein